MNNRPYQQQFVNALLPEAWAAGCTKVILALPPGSGKTWTARLTIERLLSTQAWDCWFLAHRKELIEQAYLEFKDLNPVVVWPGKPTPPPSPLRIAGKDTLGHREIKPCHKQVLVIVDEIHHGSSDTYIRLLNRICTIYPVVYVLGLTATPYTLSGKPIPGDVIVEPVKPAELFESGAILEPTVIGAAAPELGGIPLIGGDFAIPELEQRSRKLMGDMVKEIDKWSDGYPVIVRACSIADSKERVERLKTAGYRATHLDGATPAGQRDEILARLSIGGKRGHAEGVDVLSQVGIIGEGWNNPSDYERILRLRHITNYKDTPPPFVPVSLLSDCAPTMSMCLYRQAECRINRPNGDKLRTTQGLADAIPKQFARVISHSGNWQRHGFLRDHHSFELQTGAVKGVGTRDKSGLLSARYCPVCLAVWPSSRLQCSCGSALSQPRKPIQEDDSEELKPITPKAGVAASENAKLAYLANLWRQWKRDNAIKPVKVGRVAVIFHNQTGKWPTKEELSKSREIAGCQLQNSGDSD